MMMLNNQNFNKHEFNFFNIYCMLIETCFLLFHVNRLFNFELVLARIKALSMKKFSNHEVGVYGVISFKKIIFNFILSSLLN
jgi:hypothetical protein